MNSRCMLYPIFSVFAFTFFLCFAFSDEPNVTTPDTESLAALPHGLTSFGAARIGDSIYIYGGHLGSAHSYSTAEQSNQLLRLDLATPQADWHVASEGRRLQGLALVAYKTKLICVGGFEAKNAEGQEADLHSQSTVATFDTATGEWAELPPLPSGRSSHDAAIMGDTLYVVGGWDMNSPKETEWHTTALSMDLTKDKPTWRELPTPPFERRALAVAAHQNKLFVIGGMEKNGGPTRDVVIFDPETSTWSDGPALKGKDGMTGFGAAAWSIDGKLVVSCYSGDVQSISENDSEWTLLEKTRDARFFHRMLPLAENKLVSVGGASMEEGKFLTPEVISVP